jgi:tetratricopeptide (TPR) repeat protein
MKRPAAVIVMAVLCAVPLLAQQRKVPVINTGSPEGQLIQQFTKEDDPAKKIELMNQFLTKYPDSEASPWVTSLVQAEYLKTGNYDKALSTGDALLAKNPDDLDAAYTNLKAAEKKADADAVVKYANLTSTLARKSAGGAKPSDMSEDDWKKTVDYDKEVDTYTEYALYAAALQQQDPAKVMTLGDALEQHNPKSQYMPAMLGRYAVAGRQANQAEKAAAFGERAFEQGQTNADMLLLMAEQAMNKQQLDKTVAYAQKAIAQINSEAKPEGMPDADWQKKKESTLGVASWFEGVALSTEGKYAEADKALRAALPSIKDNQYLLGAATFHLGLANYKLAKEHKNPKLATDALRFSQQSAAINSPFQAQAQKNVKVIQTEYKLK